MQCRWPLNPLDSTICNRPQPIYGTDGERNPGGTGGLRSGGLGPGIPHRRRLALQLGAGHSLLRLPAGHPPGDLHCQRHRKSAHADPDGDQESRPLPERRGGQQIPMGGAEKHHRRLEPGYAGMEVRDELFCLPLHEPFCASPSNKMTNHFPAAPLAPRHREVAGDGTVEKFLTSLIHSIFSDAPSAAVLAGNQSRRIPEPEIQDGPAIFRPGAPQKGLAAEGHEFYGLSVKPLNG